MPPRTESTAEWIRSPADERAVAEGCWFDPEAAERVRTFCRKFLRHSKGEFAGQPFEFMAWQWRDWIAPLFGWRRADGSRRFRRGGAWIPKKNGKSALCSAIGLYLLVGDHEPGAEVYSAGADRDQASIVFSEAANMVESSPALASRMEIVRSTKRIVYPAGQSFFKAMSSEAYTKEGLNIHGLLFDELHAQPNRELWDTLAYGGAARRQPLQISISTAGFNRDSIGYEQYRYAKGVLDGTVHDTSFFAFVAEAAESDDWTDPKVWAKANPSLGVTVKLSALEEACREAQNSPAKENAFRRYHLNQWTEQDIRWLSLERWDRGADPIDPGQLAGRPCYAALDLAATTDLAALVLLFPPEEEGGQFDVLPFFWAPEEADRRRERENRARLREWAKAGHVELTPGDVIDYDVIRRRVNELNETYPIREVAIDRWNATHLSTQLQGDGFTVIAFGQGYASMSAPTKELEALVLAGRLRHGGHPVLRWNAANVTVEQDAAGNLKPSKRKSSEKIDGIVGTVMALGRAMMAEPVAAVSVEAW